MPVARLDIPVVARERRVGDSGGEVEDLQRRVVGRGQELGVTGRPGEVANGVVVRVVDGLDVVEVGPPVLDVAFLAAGD